MGLFIVLMFILIIYVYVIRGITHNTKTTQHTCASDEYYINNLKTNRRRSVNNHNNVTETIHRKTVSDDDRIDKLRKDYREWINNCNHVTEVVNRKVIF